MRLRPLLLTVHRWLTFVVGLFFILVVGSGVVLVFADEIEVALHRELYRATPGDVGVDRVREAIRRAYPAREIVGLRFPRPAKPVYVGSFSGAGGAMQVFVDPGTGRVLGAHPGAGPLDAVRRLHINLFARAAGARLVGVVGVMLLVMLVTGVYLWWPGLRKMALGFRLRRGRGAPQLLYDLHNVSGVLSLPVVLLVTLTGVPMAFPGATLWLAHRLGGAGEPAVRAGATAATQPIAGGRRSYDELVRIAADTIPGMLPLSMSTPTDPAAPVELRLYRHALPAPDGLARVAMDPLTGRVVRTIDPRRMSTLEALQHHWFYALHVGSYGGTPMRALYLVLAAVPLFSLVSGLIVWWSRRQGRLALEERRRETA